MKQIPKTVPTTSNYLLSLLPLTSLSYGLLSHMDFSLIWTSLSYGLLLSFTIIISVFTRYAIEHLYCSTYLNTCIAVPISLSGPPLPVIGFPGVLVMAP